MADDNPQDKLINLQAQQLAAQIANWAAQLEFQKERMRLLELPEMQGKLQVEIDKLAWDKAQGEWENAFKESSLTGTYKGQPTLEWLTQQAQMTGVLNGQQTLQGKLTDAQINQMNQTLKLANDEFLVNTTGYFNGQKTFDRQKFEAGQAQDAWKFLSTLTGAPNAFKQARAISNMPAGMQGIMDAWAGQYAAAGSGAVGSSGGHATMADLFGDAGGQAPGYGGGGGYGGGYGGGWGPPPLATPPPYQYIGGGGGAPPPGQPIVGAPRLDENSPQYREIRARLDAGQITAQQAANEWAALTGTTAPVYGPPADLTGPNSPAYREIQARYTSGQITAEQAAAEWAAISGTAPPVPPPAVTPPPGSPPPPAQPIVPVPPGTPPGTHPPNLPPTVDPGAPPSTGGLDTNSPQYRDIQARLAAGQITSDQAAAEWAAIQGGQWGTNQSEPALTTQASGTAPTQDQVWQHQASADVQTRAQPWWQQQNAQNPYVTGGQSYSYQGAGVQAPTEAWNYSPNMSGSMAVYPPGTTSPWDTPDISTQTPVSPQMAQNMYQYGGSGVSQPQPQSPARWQNPWMQPPAQSQASPVSSMPAPNQISARNYANSFDYQKELGWAAYEDQGYDKGLAQEAFKRSLPKTGGPKQGSFAF